jgi:hypothetical protein
MGDLSSGGRVDWATEKPETDRRKTASNSVFVFFIMSKLKRRLY